MKASTVEAELSSIRATRDAAAFAALLEQANEVDIADALNRLDPEDATAIVLTAPVSRLGDLLGYLSADRQLAVVERLSRPALAEVFTELAHDDRADLFNRLPAPVQEAVLPALAQAERDDIRRLAAYPEGSAGSVMTSDYATLLPEFTAGEAFEHLRQIAPDRETIYQAYVIDDERRLIGTVSLRELLVATPAAIVEQLMERDVVVVAVDAPREVAAQLISKYDLLAVPVVDASGKLVGIVTVDDAMDVAEEEATQDFRKVGAVGPLVSLRDATVTMLYRKRVFWLVVLVFGNIFSGAGIAYFEDLIAANVALVFFLPLLIDSGGNAGAQSSTLMVRALATGDVAIKDWATMFAREVTVAGLLGATMALAVSTLGFIRGGPEVALVVALTMQLIVVVGSVIGMSLPFLLSRFKMDPASASAPLITSIADATGVVLYFSVASLLLGAVGAT